MIFSDKSLEINLKIKYNVIGRVNGSRTLILTQNEKKSCRPRPSPFNNRVKFDGLYPFICVVFVSDNRVVSNFANSNFINNKFITSLSPPLTYDEFQC